MSHTEHVNISPTHSHLSSAWFSITFHGLTLIPRLSRPGKCECQIQRLPGLVQTGPLLKIAGEISDKPCSLRLLSATSWHYLTAGWPQNQSSPYFQVQAYSVTYCSVRTFVFLLEQYLSGTVLLKPASMRIPSPHSKHNSVTLPERCAHPHRRDTRKWSDDYWTRTRTRTLNWMHDFSTSVQSQITSSKNKLKCVICHEAYTRITNKQLNIHPLLSPPFLSYPEKP